MVMFSVVKFDIGDRLEVREGGGEGRRREEESDAIISIVVGASVDASDDDRGISNIHKLAGDEFNRVRVPVAWRVPSFIPRPLLSPPSSSLLHIPPLLPLSLVGPIQRHVPLAAFS